MTPLLEVRGLSKVFQAGGWLGRGRPVRAVDDVTFQVAAGEIFGLVGESGSGKTTTGRCILRLVEPTAGVVRFKDLDVRALSAAELRRARRHLQIVFQDPHASLNPRMTAETIVGEPLVIHGIGDRAARDAKVRDLIELVGLDRAALTKYPHEFSGGQRQRIGLARALALDPSLVVLDEPVSALDVSVQAQVVNLLLDLRARLGLTYLFIAHDLRLVAEVCDRVAVMLAGRIVEMGSARDVFAAPAHPYTRALLSAMPQLEPGARRTRIPYDRTAVPRVPLREMSAGHWAEI